MARKVAPKNVKPAASKKAKPKPSDRRSRASGKKGEPRVRVRMYRQGLGDCFLITFENHDRSRFRILIDCGLIIGGKRALLKDCIENLCETLEREDGPGKGKIDVLVVTHQHWDHISAFSEAKDLLDRITFDNVWMAWTENPADTLARKLRREREQNKSFLFQLAAAQGFNVETGNLDPGTKHPLAGIATVLGFFGASAGKTAEAMAAAKKRGKEVSYLMPGEKPWTTPELPGVRIYTLGPPHDEKQIKKTTAAKEQYEFGDSSEMRRAFFSAAGVIEKKDGKGNGFEADKEKIREEQLLDRPFDLTYERPLEDLHHQHGIFAKNHRDQDRARWSPLLQFLDRYYWGVDPDSGRPDQDWRRIDSDWLGLGNELALALDNATNNTSLVLAIELIDSGKVLLFPGDAQAGNWLSWNTYKWNVDGRDVTSDDLLRRTVFYKVGHHGSENATMRARGLELMESDELVAFIPVDEETAKKKHWNRMPLKSLSEQLAERTSNRVVRLDDKSKKDRSGFKPGALKVDPLFFEYTIG